MRNRGTQALVLSALAIIIAVGALIFARSDKQGDHLVTWNLYHGEFQTENATYNVEISEADRGQGFQRLVHLKLVGESGFIGITGHDYNDDEKWDRVFYCGEHELVGQHPKEGYTFGCNSVIRSKDGWVFEPCPGDEDIVQPFSDKVIDFAIAELNTVMEGMHNQEHLGRRWEWDSHQQKAVMVLDKLSG